ncbi:MAG: MarR family transcriptional regulator [Rhizobiales bacterium]|nr:MarR family transcriptional regulator [Hyphomicrobiales bacterium]
MERRTDKDLTVAEVGEASSAKCVALRVRRMSRIITRIYDEALRPLGLTGSQFTLLTTIAQQDNITAAEIGFSLDIEKSTLSRNLKRLEALQLVTMDPPAGRHGRGLHLTPAGEKAILQAYPIWTDIQRRVEEALGSKSRDAFDRMLADAERLVAA